jgi:branched-chain amino acid transport system ATP-binding protein
MGVSHVPEGRELFTELTVAENLSLGAYTRRDRDGIRQDLSRVYEYFPILAQRREQHAGSLSGGEQQMLAIARGLMSRPRLLLLDEPSLGLAPLVVKEIFGIIQTINREEEVTILLVEQNAGLALAIAEYGYVLETGRIVLADSGESLRGNETVRRSYLGY